MQSQLGKELASKVTENNGIFSVVLEAFEFDKKEITALRKLSEIHFYQQKLPTRSNSEENAPNMHEKRKVVSNGEPGTPLQNTEIPQIKVQNNSNNYDVIRKLVNTLVLYIDPKNPDRLIHNFIASNDYRSLLETELGEEIASKFLVKQSIYSVDLNVFSFNAEEIAFYHKISKIHFCEQKLRHEVGDSNSLPNQRKWREISLLAKLQNVLLENPDAKGEKLRGLIQNYRNPNYSGTQISETNQNPQIFAGFFSHRTRDLIREDWPELLETTPSSSK